MTIRIGQILGSYSLKSDLGNGAFADVFLGEHIILGTKVAIKVLRTSLIDQEVSFKQEARTIASLEHTHIVGIRDYAIDKEGSEPIPYLVMDYAAKGNILKLHPRGSRLALEQIIRYVEQIASALDFAHKQKPPIVHRDVKPENILISKEGNLLLSDFGIAVILEQKSDENNQMIAGTKAYMAPEQIEGKPVPQSDQYALGTIVYEWLCGELPFPIRGRSIEEIHEDRLSLKPLPLRSRGVNVSSNTDIVLAKVLEGDPERRYATVSEFAQSLRRSFDKKPEPLTLPPPRPGLAGLSNALTEEGISPKNVPIHQHGVHPMQQQQINRGELPVPNFHRGLHRQSSQTQTSSQAASKPSSVLDMKYLFARKWSVTHILGLLLILLAALLANMAFPNTFLWVISLLVGLSLFIFCILLKKRGLNLLLAFVFACYWATIGVMIDTVILHLNKLVLFSLVVSFGVSLVLLVWYVLTK